ncbi:MAG: alpha-1,2-fucosyltransferase, partial [Pseudanabaena sp.]
NKYVLFNPTFDEYCKYFYATRSNDFGEYPIYTKFRINIPFFLFKILVRLILRISKQSKWHEFIKAPISTNFDLNDTNFLNKVNNKVLLADGWLFRDEVNFNKHKDLIREYFTPDQEIINTINQLISECKKKSDVIIGIHIRRGDFYLWEGGKYYFHDDVYIDKMEQIENHFNSIEKRVLFLICSNEPIQAQNFTKYNIRFGINGIIEDLYSMAKCDYLIGPPSTYSMWASFYGMVPLLHIYDKHQIINLKDFLIVSQ